mgnify:CR=1 FL=1
MSGPCPCRPVRVRRSPYAGQPAPGRLISGVCAGLLFGSSIKRSPDITVDYSADLLGAMVGGVAEYLSLLMGFQFLLILVAAFYLAALATRRTAAAA